MGQLEPPSKLILFAASVEADPSLAQRLQACQHPAELLAIAADLGIDLEPQELRLWSRQLGAPCWPWHNRGSQFRRAFFDQDPRTRTQP